jgi:hypothetical protein
MTAEFEDTVYIPTLVNQLLEHRRNRQIKEADQVKSILLHEHSVQVYYRRDGTIGWSKINKDFCGTPIFAKKRIVWSMVSSSVGDTTTTLSESSSSRGGDNVPLIIVTVNNPSYRSRLTETMQHLSSLASSYNDGITFSPIRTVDLLDLSYHPSIGPNRILFEGWRQILLPMLLKSSTSNDRSIVYIAEDDIRLSNSVSPSKITNVCLKVFNSNQDLHILSLGHAYSTTNNKSLLDCVFQGKGLHATTLLALRHPQGTKLLLDCMETIPAGKRCHLDQFLFHSTLHNLGIALSDPPLVGWGEVSETLTSVGAGCRRNGGGRLEHIPNNSICTDGEVRWVRRYYTT